MKLFGPASAVGLFCEDVRQEAGDTVSIIGVMPDILEVERCPFQFGKFGFFVRVSLPPSYKPKTAEMHLLSGEETLFRESANMAQVIVQSESRPHHDPTFGLVLQFHAVALNQRIPGPGDIRLMIRIDNEETLVARLKVKVRSTPAATTVPQAAQPPSE